MSKKRIAWSAATLVAGAALVVPASNAGAQAKKKAVTVQPERQLMGVRLGRPFIDVLRRFGQPSEVQTVALAPASDQLPSLTAGAMGGGMGMSADPGMPGMGGMMGGGGNGAGGGMMGGGMMGGGGNGAGGGAMPFGGGNPFGGGGGNGAGGGAMGIPTLPPSAGFGGGGGNGAGGGMMGMPGSDTGMPGDMGAAMGQQGLGGQPEYSTAVLWIYKRPKGVRLEFLINEDEKVAQISVAAPAGVTYPGAATSRKVSLGTSYNRVLTAYGFPEKTRQLPPRFMEAYYSKKHHAAFTFDTKKSLQCVRVTVALAD